MLLPLALIRKPFHPPRASPTCCADSAEIDLLLEMRAHAVGEPVPRVLPDDANLRRLRELLDEDVRRRDISANEASQLAPMLARAATDGELLEEGVDQLLAALCMPDDAVFMDLGSSEGQALFQVAARAPLTAAVGIELLEARHATASKSLARVQKAQPPLLQTTDVRVVRGDLSELGEEACSWAEEARLREVTHAFSCSTCFDDFLLRRMAATLGDPATCPAFEALVSTRALPSQPHLALIGEIKLACSWNERVHAHVYVPTDVLRREKRSVGVLSRFLCDEDGTCALPQALSRPDELVRLTE